MSSLIPKVPKNFQQFVLALVLILSFSGVWVYSIMQQISLVENPLMVAMIPIVTLAVQFYFRRAEPS